MTSQFKIVLAALSLTGLACAGFLLTCRQAGSQSSGSGGAPGSLQSIEGTPGCSEGSPGMSGSAHPGQSQGATVSSDGTVSSMVNTGPAHQWTTEEMLMARPMPMSGEERQWVFAHKAPESIRSWTQAEFDQYVADPIGAQQILGAASNWTNLRKMLMAQIQAGNKVIHGDKKVAPGEQDNPAPVDETFISSIEDLKPTNRNLIFTKMQQCRLDITTLCNRLDSLRATAQKRHKGELLEQAISNAQP